MLMKILAVAMVCLFGACYGQLDPTYNTTAALMFLVEDHSQLDPTYNTTAALMFLVEDHNQDGVITREEMEQTFNRYDTNGNGQESRHEYTEYICATDPTLYNLAHYLYDEYDVNGDHHLTVTDYDGFFAKLDVDGDAQVTPEEFVQYWAPTLERYENVAQHDHFHGHGHSACH